MAVGHPDYWRRMVARISIEGYAPEYYYGHMGGQIDAGEQEIYLQYAIPVSYLFNVIGIVASCNMPGIVLLSVTKEGGDGIPIYFDTTFVYTPDRGLFTTMQYGDVLRVTMVNSLSVDAVFRILITGLMEFEG